MLFAVYMCVVFESTNFCLLQYKIQSLSGFQTDQVLTTLQTKLLSPPKTIMYNKRKSDCTLPNLKTNTKPLYASYGRKLKT